MLVACPPAVLVLAAEREDLARGADAVTEGAGRDEEEEPTPPPPPPPPVVVVAGGAEGGEDEGGSRIAEGDGILISMPCIWEVGDCIEMEEGGTGYERIR